MVRALLANKQDGANPDYELKTTSSASSNDASRSRRREELPSGDRVLYLATPVSLGSPVRL